MILLAAVGLIVGRLVYIQVFAADDLQAAAEAQRTVPYTTHARRGTISDRNGMVLATSIDTVSIYANTTQIKDINATAYYLTKALGGEYDYWYNLLADAPKPPADGTNVCLVRYGDLELQAAINAVQDELKPYALAITRLQARLDPQGSPVWYAETPLSCINFVPEYKRVYPYGQIGAQVIGNVDSEGHGICGLELQYDAILAGKDGVVSVEVGYDGTPLPNGKREEDPKVDGANILISIDIDLQEYLESELSRIGELGAVEFGSATVLDGASGEIYATASLPLYDRENITTEQIIAGAMNLRSITVPYEPGSTMKGVTCAAVLEAGVFDTSEWIYVPASLSVDGYRVRDYYDRSDQEMDLRTIMLNSSNVGMSLVAQRLGKQGLFDYFYQAGFYQPSHVDYQGLSGVGEPVFLNDGIDASGAYVSIADKPYLWSDILFSNLTFGQGLMVTALQMTSYYGAIANDGMLYQPHFLINLPQSSEPIDYQPRRIMTEATADTMVDLLESVVTDGTGMPAQIPGYRVAGKTGTAEKASETGGYSDQVIQSMVGFFIDGDCDLVCMVTTDDAGMVGGAVASKAIFVSIMEYMANRYRVEPSNF